MLETLMFVKNALDIRMLLSMIDALCVSDIYDRERHIRYRDTFICE